MTLKDKLLNLITLGAHARMQTAFEQYDTAYLHYHTQFQVAQQLEQSVLTHLEQLGGQVQHTLQLIERSQHLLALQTISRRVEYAAQPQMHSVAGAKLLLQDHQQFSLSKPAHQKPRIHLRISTGVWAMTVPQSAVSAPSTWGDVQISQLPVIPKFKVAWWDRYVSMEQLQHKTQELLDVQQELDNIVPIFAQQLVQIEQRTDQLSVLNQQLAQTYQQIDRQLYPLRWLSHLYRQWRQLLGYGYFAKHEQPLLSQLDLLLYEVAEQIKPTSTIPAELDSLAQPSIRLEKD